MTRLEIYFVGFGCFLSGIFLTATLIELKYEPAVKYTILACLSCILAGGFAGLVLGCLVQKIVTLINTIHAIQVVAIIGGAIAGAVLGPYMVNTSGMWVVASVFFGSVIGCVSVLAISQSIIQMKEN